MELIDLYVKEVGQHLPEKMREDIQKEIRSMIEDTLEDESRSQGKAIDETMVTEVLKRLGPPQKMADSYLPPKYVVGPALYPHFITTLRIVLPIIAVFAVIGLGVSLGWSARLPQDVARAIGQAALGLFDSMFHAVGIIVIIFAIIQWTSPNIKIAQKQWDPRSLKAEPDPERIKPAGQIAETILAVFAIIVFNLYPQLISFASFHDGQWFTAPLLTAAFSQYVPWISLLLALQAGLHIALLSQGRWSTVTRWAWVALTIFGIGIGLRLLTGPAIVNLDQAALARLGWSIPDPAAFKTLADMTDSAVRLAIGISIAAQAIEIVKNLYKLLLKGRLPVAFTSGSI